eukprot:TRINITY_DN5045_c0_g1_i4.p1 TRINITY_DN5045_c0_g1~~TRINITY_DN5045_c0_g1_i4.p1  ORF type:complete len:265 (+),score=63.40 TRINITY_DN5045_c0_g1_i4:386-1180(+)
MSLAGIPHVFSYGLEGDYNVMVMEYLGSSLEDLFIHNQKHFSLKTTLMLAGQMVTRLEYIHSRQYLHRDIKPDNFAMGRGQKASLVYLIDFGLAKRYRDAETGLHIPYKEGKSLTGTARYASIRTHMGIEQSRRDDVEGLLYVLVYFLKGELPWQKVVAKNKEEKYKKIMEIKKATDIKVLCDGLPGTVLFEGKIDELQALLSYVRELQFEEEPNYEYIRSSLEEAFNRHGFTYDFNFDWSARKSRRIVFPGHRPLEKPPEEPM